MNYLLPILAVLLSFGFVFITKPKNKNHFKLLLAFSGALLLALTIFELFPEVYENADTKTVGLFIMSGILLQIFLEFFSKGAEHGHVHIDSSKTVFPIMLFASLSVHSLLEGLPINNDGTILYGILVHKVPIAIILSIFLLNSKMKLSYSLLFIGLFSIMTPLGTFLAGNINFIKMYTPQINALVIGVFLHISTVILFESSEGHTFNIQKLMVIIMGIAVAYFM